MMPPFEQHGEYQQRHVDVARLEVGTRQRVGGHDGEHDVDGGAHAGVEQAVAVADPHLAVLEDGVVGAQRRLHRQQPHLAAHRRLRRADRGADDVDQRVGDADQHQRQERVVEAVEDHVDAALADAPAHHAVQVEGGLAVYHRLVPLTRRAIQFTTRISARLMTELNSPMAVANE